MAEISTKEVTKQRLEEIEKELSELQEQYESLKARWEIERSLIYKIRGIKEEIEQTRLAAEQAERDGDYSKAAELRYGKLPELRKKLEEAQQELEEVQKDGKLLKEEVEPEDIAEIISKWTGIPVHRMLESEREKLLKMEERIKQRVVGQDEAVAAVCNAIRRSRAGLQDPNRPIGSFIFLGTTGVGKTELARALAEFLFDDEHAMIRIDMSEYMEKFAVTRLIGAPPGYVGYEEGGQLTEAVRRHPYSVVLLDEIEKAHPDVYNLLLQVLDDGRLTDSHGRTVNFTNTIIIMTSNMGTELIQERLPDITEANREKILSELKAQIYRLLQMKMRPEFLNRIDDIILFNPLTEREVKEIAKIQLKRVEQRLQKQNLSLSVTDAALRWLAQKGFDINYGARPLKRVIERAVVDPIALKILSGEILPGQKIIVDVAPDNTTLTFTTEEITTHSDGQQQEAER